MVSDNAAESICPKGWRLPSGNTDGEYAKLITDTYGILDSTDGVADRLRSEPFKFKTSGHYTRNNISQKGGVGYYWTSSAGEFTRDAYRFVFEGAYVYPSNTASRYYGYTVRCVAR